ncbi:MAG: transporter substrate-binding domain-containing protein, partial [Carbonactinosporaceae bacterium]
MRVRTIAGAALAAALAVTLTACGGGGGGGEGEGPQVKVQDNPEFPAGSTMAKLSEAGKVKVGIKYDQPLFGEKTLEGDFAGFDVEIAEAVAAEMGIKPEDIDWVEAVSANREPFIQQGKVDFVAATYTIDEERDKVVDFAGPYYVAGQQIMVEKG